MLDILTEEEIARLGLKGAKFNPVQKVSIADTSPQGKSFSLGVTASSLDRIVGCLMSPTCVTILASLLGNNAFAEREIGLKNDFGWRFFLVPDGFKIVGDTPMSAEAIGQTVEIKVFEEGRSLLFPEPGKYLVRLPENRGSVIWYQKDQIEFQEFWLPPAKTKTVAKNTVPLEQLIKKIQNPWLIEELEKYHHGTLSRIVGIGLILRYWSSDLSSAETKKLFTDLMNNKVPDLIQEVDLWRNSLKEKEIKSIMNRVYASINKLKNKLQKLSKSFSLEQTWINQFIDCCIKRDDLEAIRWTLPESPALDKRLKSLDDYAWNLVVSLPGELSPNHPRLLRARALDPDAWWIRPVQSVEDFPWP